MGLLFPPDEPIVRAVFKFARRIGDFIEQNFFTLLFPPALQAFLVRDAEEPASKFRIVTQSADVPGGGDKRLLNDVEARLFVVRQFKNINVKR